MDPLSVTASVIACIQAASAVVSVCLDYRAALSKAPWGLSKAIEDVRDLRNILETFESIASRAKIESFEAESEDKQRWASLQLLCVEDGPLQRCAAELSRLETKLYAPKWAQNLGRKRKALIQAVGWQLKDSEVKASLDTIERYKTTITLALTADKSMLLAEIHALSISVQDDVSTIHENLSSLIRDQQMEKLDEWHKAMLKWLSPASASGTQTEPLATDSTDNRNWILESEEFLGWRNSTTQTPILLLTGIPGAGKTTLLTKVLHHFQTNVNSKTQSELVAYFYCSFRAAESQIARNIVGSLIAQLCIQTGSFPQELEDLFEESTDSTGKNIAPGLTNLTSILVSLSALSNIVLFIDALDECGDCSEITEVLENIRQTDGIKIFVACRDDPRILSSLKKCIQIRLENRTREVSSDIGAYIQRRLDTEPKLQWLRSSFKEDIQKTLVWKSGGMFRWVQCQIDQITPLRTTGAIRKALNDLPDGLYETYERILLLVPRYHVDVVLNALRWLCYATDPLTLAELHEAIAIDPDLDFLDEESQLSSPQDILDLCGSLITVTDYDEVQLAHASVKEYLLSNKIKISAAAHFALDPNESVVFLARSCLAYLSFKEFESGPTQSQAAFRSRLARYPLLNHAAVAWPYQTLAAGEPPKLLERVDQFLTGNHDTFMSWIQVLNARPVRRRLSSPRWNSYPRKATPLYYAASFGLYHVVQSLIKAGVDLDASASRFGGTALHGAVVRHHLPVIEMLLEAGADVNKVDDNGVAPLQTAVWHEETAIVSMLVKYGATSTKTLDT